MVGEKTLKIVGGDEVQWITASKVKHQTTVLCIKEGSEGTNSYDVSLFYSFNNYKPDWGDGLLLAYVCSESAKSFLSDPPGNLWCFQDKVAADIVCPWKTFAKGYWSMRVRI